MLYSLESSVFSENAMIDLADNANRFHDLFLTEKKDDKFLKYTKIRFISQRGYNSVDIQKSDYLQSSTGVPIVSKKFLEAVSSIVKDDVVFYPCEVICGSSINLFYVGKIITYAVLVNYNASNFRHLVDGRKILQYPRYNLLNTEDFFIARDINYPHLFAISTKLVRVIEEHNLNVVCNTLPVR